MLMLQDAFPCEIVSIKKVPTGYVWEVIRNGLDKDDPPLTYKGQSTLSAEWLGNAKRGTQVILEVYALNDGYGGAEVYELSPMRLRG